MEGRRKTAEIRGEVWISPDGIGWDWLRGLLRGVAATKQIQRQEGAPVIQRFLQLASSKGVLAIPSEALSLKELLRIHLKPVFKI